MVKRMKLVPPKTTVNEVIENFTNIFPNHTKAQEIELTSVSANRVSFKRVSPLSGKLYEMEIDMSFENFCVKFQEYSNGKLIQVAFPELSPAKREFIQTGIPPAEFPPDPDDE